MLALDTQLPSSRDGASSGTTWRAEHPSTSGRLPTPDALLIDFQQRGDLQGADTGGDPSTDRYLARSTGLAFFVTISPQQVTPPYESSRRRSSPIQVTQIHPAYSGANDRVGSRTGPSRTEVTSSLRRSTGGSPVQYRCRSIGHVPSSGPTIQVPG